MSTNLLLGERLKKRRSEIGLSLRELARRTELTAAFLSQVERGISNPSLNSLRRIANALNVPMLYFLADKDDRSPVVRANNRPQIDLDESNITYEMLSPDLSGKFEAIQGRLKPGNDNIVRKLSVDTEEMILVLQGSLLVGLSDQDYILHPGDTITFQGKDIVKLICASDQEVQWISVITPPVF
jgi:transcriptional regulator with XRE-family HTH domain